MLLRRLFFIGTLLGACGNPATSVSAPTTRYIQFKSRCSQPVSVAYKLPDGSIKPFTVTAGSPLKLRISQLASNQANAFFAVLAPKAGSSLCQTYDCGTWGDTLQQNNAQGKDWLGKWANYATLCQATLARAGACAQNAQSGCCGLGIDNDGSFGSLFEITPHGYARLDYLDISTNYDYNNGSLVFFSIPFQVVATVPEGDCISNGKPLPHNTLTCLTADCPDGYTTPTDPKQIACPDTTSSYQIQFCPKSGKHPYR